MRKFKIIFLATIVSVLIFYSCNKFFPDGEPSMFPTTHIALIDSETGKDLFDTIQGTEYHLDSVKLFNQDGKQIDVFPNSYICKNDTCYAGQGIDDYPNFCITFDPFNVEVNDLYEKHERFDSTFYLYLNQYDTDTLIYHFNTDTIIENMRRRIFIEIEYLNYEQQQQSPSQVILIQKNK